MNDELAAADSSFIRHHSSFIIHHLPCQPPIARMPAERRNGLSSEILDRLPPHNLEAEKGVIGSLLLDPDLCDDVAVLLRPDDFYAEANQKLYAHLLEMRDQGGRIDSTLLLERLSSASDLEAIGGAAYLAEVLHSVPHAANAVYYAQIVRDKATLRALIHASTEILRDAYEPTLEPREMVSRAEEMIFAVHDQRSTDQITTIDDLLHEAFDRIDARLDRREGVGVPTGFQDLDNLTGGLHDSELVILAARPSMGKTALATNIAENVAIKAKVPTLFVSLEMARLELAQRMLCSQGRVDANKFRSGFMSAEDRREVGQGVGQTVQYALVHRRHARPKLHGNRRLRPAFETQAQSRTGGDRLPSIDPARRPPRPAPRAGGQDGAAAEGPGPRVEDSRALRGPIEPAGGRGQGKEGHRPRLSQLRESGAIEQDADVVMFIHSRGMRSTPRGSPEKGRAGKRRASSWPSSATARPATFKLAWFDKYTCFENLSQKPYEEFDNHQEDF